MSEAIKGKYKSPLHKVLNMLERGRDNWKSKYREAKSQIKYLQNKLRRIEQSQQEWKRKAQESVLEVKRLQAAIELHKQEAESLAKKSKRPAKVRY